MRLIRSISKRYIKKLGKISIYKRNGLNLLLNPKNHVDYRLAARLPFEVRQMQYAQRLITDKNLSVFLDIGSNIGLYSITLGKLDQIRDVHAFEPVKANFNQLSANVFLNNLNHKVATYQFALGSTPSQANIYIEPSSTGRSRLNPAYSGDAAAFTQSEVVHIRKLDDVLPLTGQRVFIKIDVEGHTVDVLKGMHNLLDKNTVFIQAELLEYDRKDIIQYLKNLGYDLFHQIDVDGYFARK